MNLWRTFKWEWIYKASIDNPLCTGKRVRCALDIEHALHKLCLNYMINDDVQLYNMLVTNKLMNCHSMKMHDLCNIHTRQQRATEFLFVPNLLVLFCVCVYTWIPIWDTILVLPLLSMCRCFFDIGTCCCYCHGSHILWCILIFFEHFFVRFIPFFILLYLCFVHMCIYDTQSAEVRGDTRVTLYFFFLFKK